MRRPAQRRKATTSVLATMLLAIMAVIVVAGASAASPTTTTTSTSSYGTNNTSTGTTPTSTTQDTPASHFFVVNGTANASSDHEIVGSSAFPNYTTGAVDNSYAKAHSHVDNSPFAEGTASPADSGPVGQTAAAGNFQQPQYADARWPGDTGKATYGSQGGPYATAEASDYKATADASEASNGLSAPGTPGASTGIAVPKGFDDRLRQALARWRAKWQDRLDPKKPIGGRTVTIPTATVTTPLGRVTTPSLPTPPVTTPAVTTPALPVGGLKSSPPPPPPPPPPVTVPVPVPLPSKSGGTAASSRSLASASAPASADGASALESSTLATVDPKTLTLVTSGESRLGRVSLGGGQILIEGIHVTASITNDGTPAYKAAVSVAAASIGGVPVTIDEDGVHINGQGQGAPYKQASDALNGALKQAGVQLFLVGPEVTTGGSCDQSGSGGGSGTTTTSSNDQSGFAPPCDSGSCSQTGSGSGGGSGTTTTTTAATTTTSTDQSGSTSPCDQTTSCGQTGSGTGTGTSSTTTTTSGLTPPTTTGKTTTTTSTTTTSDQSGSSWCDQTGMTTPTSSCTQTGATSPTSPNGQSAATTDTTNTDQTTTDQSGMGGGPMGSGDEQKVTATGVHLVFTQPVGQSGVPSQFAEHILGEVFVDSLAVPAPPVSKLDLNFNSSFNSNFNSGSGYGSGSSGSSCLGGRSHGTKGSFAGAAGGGSSAGGLGASGSPAGYASGAAGSQFGSNAGGSPLGSALQGVASFLRTKPLWVLIAFLLWQAIAVVTGASLRSWRRDGTA